MSRLVYVAQCPGCSKRIHAPSEDVRRRHMARHARNCNALKKMGALVPLESLPAAVRAEGERP